MKKVFIFTISLAILVSGIVIAKNNHWFDSPTAFAVGDLTVNWGVPNGQPLFNISNAAPGNTVTRTVVIQNGASSSRPIGIRGVITQINPLTYSQKLFIKISRNGTDLYGANNSKTLQNFINEAGINGISLGTLANGASQNFDITLTFDSNADNSYQNASIKFDLIIGISVDIPEACNSIQFNGPTIFGTDENDRIAGTSKNELVVTFNGNDTVDGGSGDDCIIATGTGNKILNGGSGNDVIVGSNGNDNIQGGSGNDISSGNAGNDVMDGGSGNDRISGGANNDTMSGGSGDDILDGNSGTDSANGGSGNDRCVASTKMSCEL